MDVYKDPHKFEKELAKINAQLTIVTTGGSVFALFGISLVVLGVTIGSNSLSKTGFEYQVLNILSNVYTDYGIVIFIIGLILLLVAQFLIPKKIDKLKFDP